MVDCENDDEGGNPVKTDLSSLGGQTRKNETSERQMPPTLDIAIE